MSTTVPVHPAHLGVITARKQVHNKQSRCLLVNVHKPERGLELLKVKHVLICRPVVKPQGVYVHLKVH